MPYRYEHFERRVRLDELRFHGGVLCGEPFPDFDLSTTDGGRICKQDYAGARPLLLTIGSATCPMTRSAGRVLKRLHAVFGDRVGFVTLYVREAHPGDALPQPATLEEKLARARAYRERDGIPWPVAVDDLEGTLHMRLGGGPNHAYLVDREGRVAFRAQWSTQERALRRALATLVAGRVQRRTEREAWVVPFLSGLGSLREVLGPAGPRARSDAFQQTPAMYLLGEVAGLFRPLPPVARGLCAVVTAGLGVLVAVVGARRFIASAG